MVRGMCGSLMPKAQQRFPPLGSMTASFDLSETTPPLVKLVQWVGRALGVPIPAADPGAGPAQLDSLGAKARPHFLCPQHHAPASVVTREGFLPRGKRKAGKDGSQQCFLL